MQTFIHVKFSVVKFWVRTFAKYPPVTQKYYLFSEEFTFFPKLFVSHGKCITKFSSPLIVMNVEVRSR